MSEIEKVKKMCILLNKDKHSNKNKIKNSP